MPNHSFSEAPRERTLPLSGDSGVRLSPERQVPPEEQKATLRHGLHVLIKLPFTEWNRFSTIDFLEDATVLLNKYDDELVRGFVKEFVKEPVYNVRACEALLELARLSRSERAAFLSRKREELGSSL